MRTEDIKPYILAGKAIFTLYSSKINRRHTYKICKDEQNSNRYSVYVLYGQDNTEDYKFVGVFYVGSGYSPNYKLLGTVKNIEMLDDVRFIMMKHFLRFVRDGEFLDTCSIIPSRKCARCGRLLTTPESIERGLGPECYIKEAI